MSRHLPESNDQDTMSICDICLRNQERHVNFTTCGELWAKFSNLRENSEEKLRHHAARDKNLEVQSEFSYLSWRCSCAETKPIEQEETMSMSMSRHLPKSNDPEQNVNVNV